MTQDTEYYLLNMRIKALDDRLAKLDMLSSRLSHLEGKMEALYEHAREDWKFEG